MLINSISSSIVPRVPFLLRKNLGGRESSSVRVVTDIDDTVKSSGGVRLFGIALGGVDVSNVVFMKFSLYFHLFS
jgi:hypothetical protein